MRGRSRITGYLTPVLSTAAALLARFLLNPVLGAHAPYATFYIAVAASAWLGGGVPGIIAAALGALAALYFFVPPPSSILVTGADDQVNFTLYLIVSAVIVYFSHVQHRTRRQLEAEVALREQRESAERLERQRFEFTVEAVMEHIPEGLAIINAADTKIRLMSRQGAELLGRPRAALEGMAANELFALAVYHSDGRTRAAPEDLPLAAALERGEIATDQEWVIKTPGGKSSVVLCNTAPIRGTDRRIAGALMACRDITKRKDAEAALRESESRFRALMSASSQVLYRMSPDWSEMLELSGGNFLANTETPSRNWLQDYIPADEQPLVRAAISEAVRTGSIFKLEHRVRGVDGSVGWTLSRAVPVLDRDGRIVEWFGAASDITPRKQAEEALRKRAAELAAVWDAAPVAIFVSHDPECREITGSPAAYEFLRMPPGSNLSKSTPEPQSPTRFRTMKDGREIPPQDLPMQVAAATGMPVRDFEFDIVYEDGTLRNLLGTAVAIFDEDGRPDGSVGAFMDVTGLKRTEERLRQVQKLESVGLLAGGIAHDFNNLLTGIMGNASMVVDEVDPASAERIKEVIGSAERAANLTRQLLAYAGKGQFVVQDLDPSETVNAMADLLQFSIPKSVDLALHLQKRLPAVQMDPSQFEQIVLNLVINAGEAIGDVHPGRITVATGMSDIEEPFVDALGQEIASGRYVIVEIGDTGGGIGKENLSKIFDPFFTTKFTGRGLGLAAVAGILRAQHGGITVQSEPDEGSTFRVLLRADRASSGQPEQPEAGGRGAILVVDDEPSVRSFIGTALRWKGYRVLDAADGLHALAALDREQGDVEGAVLDVVMPGICADDLLEALRIRRPNLRVLLTTGYSESEARRLCRAHPGVAFIQKPYTASQLVKSLEAVLGAGNSRAL